MLKLGKFYYYNKNGEKNINCYYVNLKKKDIEKAGITESDKLEIQVEQGRIIIIKK